MGGRTSDWKGELERFLKPFLTQLATRRGGRCARFMYRDWSVLAIARAFSRWRSGLQLATTINCTHFIAPGIWDAKPVETELLAQADKLVGGSERDCPL